MDRPFTDLFVRATGHAGFGPVDSVRVVADRDGATSCLSFSFSAVPLSLRV
jgi:hypothetical protein